MKVHRSAFTPPPKVMSAVVHITPAAMPDGVRPADMARLTAAAFGQRRKMLRQSLKAIVGADAAMETCAIDPTRRAETLSVEEFVTLARTIRVQASR
jgi:16S rRNA (adenine1518-N6/adenine1519-N6)-dimethyltransferase